MKNWFNSVGTAVLLSCIIGWAATACGKKPSTPATRGEDPEVKTRGTVELTVQLAELPEGLAAGKPGPYATVFRYKVMRPHRGQISSDTIYVAHYNPLKPRSQASDDKVKGIGGNLKEFRARALHRIALEVPLENFYTGQLINQYTTRNTGPLYWAVWTNEATD